MSDFYEPETLVNRLNGIYDIGPNAEFGVRSFEDCGFHIPPINREAARRIQELEGAIKKHEMVTLIAEEMKCGFISDADKKLWSVLDNE